MELKISPIFWTVCAVMMMAVAKAALPYKRMPPPSAFLYSELYTSRTWSLVSRPLLRGKKTMLLVSEYSSPVGFLTTGHLSSTLDRAESPMASAFLTYGWTYWYGLAR